MTALAGIIPPVMTTTNKPNEIQVTRGDSRATLTLDGRRMTLDTIDVILGAKLSVSISDGLWDRMKRSYETVAKIAGGENPAYGINTGFGRLCNKRISADETDALQRNLIISHAVGVGEPIGDEFVRLMMLLKVHALTHGLSGIARSTVDCMLNMLENDLLPVVPSQGSLGASGDLAPLAHMVRPMLGLATVRRDGVELPATEAFATAGLAPIDLGPKEGLALINGTQFMSAHACAILVRAHRLIKHADIFGAMSLEGYAGSLKPFDERLHEARPHRGAIEAAANIRLLMKDSEILAAHQEDCPRVQDPYSLRCIPQVHGAVRDAMRHAKEVVEIEINAVTDNPLIFGEDVISGGSFHGEPLALVLDYLAVALSELASISERRIYLLLSGEHGLPALLMEKTGLNSGFMLPQYTAAALVSENKVLASPASVDSIPTSLGQEDHVSMGATAARKCLRVLQNTETVLAIEQMCAAQAVDFRAPHRPGTGPRIAHEIVRESIPHAVEDRLFGEDIQISLSILRSNRILKPIEESVGNLR